MKRFEDIGTRLHMFWQAFAIEDVDEEQDEDPLSEEDQLTHDDGMEFDYVTDEEWFYY